MNDDAVSAVENGRNLRQEEYCIGVNVQKTSWSLAEAVKGTPYLGTSSKVICKLHATTICLLFIHKFQNLD
jgi:hypothetical protein